MFTLTKFDITPLRVEVAFVYDMKDGKKNRIEESFGNAIDANHFIQLKEKSYLLQKLRAFILHKKIQSNGPTWNKLKDAVKLRSLDHCMIEMERLQDSSICTLVNAILNMKDDLKNIVHDDEWFWEGEYEKLDDIINNCTEYISAKRKTIA